MLIFVSFFANMSNRTMMCPFLMTWLLFLVLKSNVSTNTPLTSCQVLSSHYHCFKPAIVSGATARVRPTSWFCGFVSLNVFSNRPTSWFPPSILLQLGLLKMGFVIQAQILGKFSSNIDLRLESEYHLKKLLTLFDETQR